MAEAFEPITTQEAFDAAVEQRLAPYADYNEIKAQNETYAGQIVELNSRIQTYETEALKTRIAHEVGIPFDLAQRLTGSTVKGIGVAPHSFASADAPVVFWMKPGISSSGNRDPLLKIFAMMLNMAPACPTSSCMHPRMPRWTCSVPLRTALPRRWPRVWT